jgi:hypothetical protein
MAHRPSAARRPGSGGGAVAGLPVAQSPVGQTLGSSARREKAMAAVTWPLPTAIRGLGRRIGREHLAGSALPGGLRGAAAGQSCPVLADAVIVLCTPRFCLSRAITA